MLKNNLGEDKISSLILKLAVPSMLAQFVNVLYTIVDRFFVVQIKGIGNLALASVGVAAPITTLIMSFAFLIGLGGAPIMAIKMGEQNDKRAEKILFNCAFSLVVVSLILMAISYLLKDYFLRWFGASDDTFGYANEYLTYYLIGTIFAVCGLGLNSFVTAQGYSGVSMAIVIASALTNILLDYVFILVLDMGVMGAAVATVIAQAVSFFALLGFLLSKRPKIRLKLNKLDFSIIKKVVAMGFGPFFIISTDSILIIVLNSVMQKTGGANGDTYLSAITIVLAFMQLITTPMAGITSGCQPIISYNYGAKNIKRVKKAIFGVLITCALFCLVMTFVSVFASTGFAVLFTKDETVLALASKWIKIYTSGIMFLSVQYALVDSLVALGSPVISASLSFNRKLAIAVLTGTLPFAMGAVGTVAAEAIGDVYSMVVSSTVCLLTVNKLLKKRENAEIQVEE